MTAPLTPPDCDLRDFAFMPLDPGRLFGSEFHAIASDSEWRAGVCLWLKSWHQVPAASLPNDDTMLCRLAEFGRDIRSWRKVRDVALRGWVLCDDGRLYHPTVAEKAVEAWARKQAFRKRTEKARQARLGARDGGGNGSVTDAVDRSVTDPVAATTGTGTGTITSSDEEGASAPIDADAKAWREAVDLLKANGRMSDAAARKFFGGLLKAHAGLEARDLLASIAQAVANGTQDPQAYLTKAAAGVDRRRSGAPAPSAPAQPIDWTERVRIWRQTGQWLLQWGAEPGDPQCRCPRDLLEGV